MSALLPSLRAACTTRLPSGCRPRLSSRAALTSHGLNGSTPPVITSPFAAAPLVSGEDSAFAAPVQPRVVDVSQLLSEASALAENFVFEDNDDDEEVWEHEHRLAATPQPADEAAAAPQVQGALDPDMVSVTSAYSSEQGFKELQPAQLKEGLRNGQLPLLLDVRAATEFSTAHIPGSCNIPLSELSAAVRAGQLDRYRSGPVAVVCASGVRSAQATVRLTKVFNFPDVSNVAGGIARWQEHGFRVASG